MLDSETDEPKRSGQHFGAPANRATIVRRKGGSLHFQRALPPIPRLHHIRPLSSSTEDCLLPRTQSNPNLHCRTHLRSTNYAVSQAWNGRALVEKGTTVEAQVPLRVPASGGWAAGLRGAFLAGDK